VVSEEEAKKKARKEKAKNIFWGTMNIVGRLLGPGARI
jgi:hypothetical protein